ncbi:MAG: hypothetical protein NTV46_07790, partial [Verrucomicrobia bacterium]|nr:hypothetical protein [Verrucomicrobiota bacterium]
MIRTIIIPWLFSMAGLAAAGAPDLLRFTNSDQLHGTFVGIKDGPRAVWQRTDLAAPVDFKTTRIRHVVLHGGRPLKPLESLSHLGLVNGDRIPGTITGIDDDHVTLDTTYAGVLRIPRRHVSLVAPNPLGGRMYYHGPFVEDEWKMTHASFPEGLPNAGPADKAKDDKAQDDKAKDDKAQDDKAQDDKLGKDAGIQPGRWFFSGSAWYWKSKHGGTTLIRETGMPDRAVLRFDLAWKNRLCVSLGFHADFARAKPKEGAVRKKENIRGMMPGDTADLARLFGNSYVLQMYSNYIMLYRTSINEDGNPALEPVQMNHNNLRLMESGAATVEVRSNRRSGEISLFVNDEFITQWYENDGTDRAGKQFAGKGEGFGFVVQGDDSPIRISDIIVSEWNGMPDSARSLQMADQDIVLMANGTDRYAGRVDGLDKEGKVFFEGKHGQFHFPLQEVAEIRFASKRLAAAPDEPADNFVVRFGPIGAVSGRPVSSNGSTLEMLSPSAGTLKL